MLGNIGPLEIIVVLIIALMVFGPKRLPELGNSLGKGIREFKDSVTGDRDDDDGDDDVKAISAANATTTPPPPAATATPVEQPAATPVEQPAATPVEKPAEPEAVPDKHA